MRCSHCATGHYQKGGRCNVCGEVFIPAGKPFPIEMKAVVVEACDEKLIDDLMRLEAVCFLDLDHEDFNREYYQELLESEDTISIFLEAEGERVGCLILIPHNQAIKELEDDDPGIASDPARFYVETVEILPEFQGQSGLTLMLESLKKYGVRKVSLHARVNNDFSAKIQKKLKAVKVRRIESWPYYEDRGPTDYNEGSL